MHKRKKLQLKLHFALQNVKHEKGKTCLSLFKKIQYALKFGIIGSPLAFGRKKLQKRRKKTKNLIVE